MISVRKILVVASLLIVVFSVREPLFAQAPTGPTGTRTGLDPAAIAKPLADSWPTFAGDYTSRRYSALKAINKSNVKNLALAWVSIRATGPRGGVPPTIIGGVGTREFTGGTMKGAILQVNGILYVTAPDNVWALDARDGREIWHYFWKTRAARTSATGAPPCGGTICSSRRPTTTSSRSTRRPARSAGTSRSPISTSSISRRPRPIIAGDHVIVGTGNDLDGPGFLQSFDPETGKLQWKFYTVPMNPGDPGLETWPNLDAARYGGGHTWMPGSYDPETRLYIFGTGNPTPAYTGVGRPGDNLFTCSLIAVNVDTGKMAWYYQMSPHDTHDWDAVQAPILIDARVNGKPRKLVSMAARNGYFFTVDRVTGEHIVTTRYGSHTNWSSGLNAKGAPMPESGKGSHHSGRVGVASRGRYDQLAAGGIFAGHRPALHAGIQRVQHAVSHRSRSARVDGARRKDARRRGSSADSSRPSSPQPGKSPGDDRSRITAAPERERAPRNRGRASVRRRRQRQLRRVRREGGEAALAHAASAPSPTPRKPTCHRRQQYVLVATGDHALGVYAELRDLNLETEI